MKHRRPSAQYSPSVEDRTTYGFPLLLSGRFPLLLPRENSHFSRTFSCLHPSLSSSFALSFPAVTRETRYFSFPSAVCPVRCALAGTSVSLDLVKTFFAKQKKKNAESFEFRYSASNWHPLRFRRFPPLQKRLFPFLLLSPPSLWMMITTERCTLLLSTSTLPLKVYLFFWRSFFFFFFFFFSSSCGNTVSLLFLLVLYTLRIKTLSTAFYSHSSSSLSSLFFSSSVENVLTQCFTGARLSSNFLAASAGPSTQHLRLRRLMQQQQQQQVFLQLLCCAERGVDSQTGIQEERELVQYSNISSLFIRLPQTL